jgi:hypothetical protein
MAERKIIVLKFDPIEKFLLENAILLIKPDLGIDYEVLKIFDFVPDHLKRFVNNPRFGDYITSKIFKETHAVVYLPAKNDQLDWFRQLYVDGYNGKMVILDRHSEATARLGSYATDYVDFNLRDRWKDLVRVLK